MKRAAKKDDSMGGRVTFTRSTVAGGEGPRISFYVVDDSSGVQFLSGEMGLTEFAEMITGRGDVMCRFKLSHAGLVGMKSEHKKELVEFDCYAMRPDSDRKGLESCDRSPSVDKVLKPFEVDGWRANVSDLFNGHRTQRSAKTGGRNMQEVIFYRHVDPKTGQPIQ